MTKNEIYTELSIQIATLDMKLDAILKWLNKPEITIEPFKITAHDHVHIGVGSTQELNNPPQWPNESHTDYLKRIGQWNEASSEGYSDEEWFGESYK